MANFTTNKLEILGDKEKIEEMISILCKWQYKNLGSYPEILGPNSIKFYTVWCAYPELICNLSRLNPKLSFIYAWTNEGCGTNGALLKIQNGEVIKENLPEDNTQEAYKIECYVYNSPYNSDFVPHDEEC